MKLQVFAGIFFVFWSCIMNFSLTAQRLEPGFSKAEYIEMIKVYARQADTPWTSVKIPEPADYHFVYRSATCGMDNKWDLWVNKANSIAIISIRGTTYKAISWVENFYAAMVPATGQLEISEKETFTYQLAENPKAAVHVGWLVATAFLAPDIVSKMDSCYQNGIKDFIILGHSQGGAISYLMTSHLLFLKKQGKLPADIQLKTYCSAGPKPGNLYYAYEYESMTSNGWAYNVVNSADWVPEVPVSIQTLYDFNRTNPFVNLKKMAKKLKFPQDLIVKYVFNQLDRPTRKAQRKYQKFLGNLVSKFVVKHIPEFKTPCYVESNHYVRTGNYIVLLADDAYYKIYPDSKEQIFIHHMFEPYLFLAEKLPDDQ